MVELVSNIHPSLLQRKIIHIDMDAFYASVEIRERPELIDQPVIVGGKPTGRGVVSTCNYIARKYGVHSAMPSSRAYRLCPQAVFVGSNFALYKEISAEIREILKNYTALVEPVSLDEAYLDVTDQARGRTATEIAEAIRQDIFQVTRLTASAGVAPNKMLAKIASDMNKPDGITIIKPHQVLGFMQSLNVRKIPGVGKVTAGQLENIGIRECKDVDERLNELIKRNSRFAGWLLKRSKGVDTRPVSSQWTRKSVGHESTFFQDKLSVGELDRELQEIITALEGRLKKLKLMGKTITLKVKYSDFKQITRSKTLSTFVDESSCMYHVCKELISLTDIGSRKVRLLGVSLSNLNNDATDGSTYYQPSLFDS